MTPRSSARRVLVIAPSFQPWDLGTYLIDALRLRGVRARQCSYAGRTRSDAGAAVSRALDEEPTDVVIGLKMERVDAEVLRAIRARGAALLLWYVDCFTPRVPSWLARLLPEVDVFATTAAGMVPAFERAGARRAIWVPEGVHLPAFKPLRSGAPFPAVYRSDVAFVGNVFQPPVHNPDSALRRWRLLDQLGARFDVAVWGPQTPLGAARHLAYPRVRLVRWPAYNDELVNVCRGSRIVLGINTVNTIERYFSNRTFLTLASGGFHLTHYVPGLEELFVNHRHLVWFHSDEECLELCAHYLGRDTARRRIADAGRAYVRRRWSMRRQAGVLLQAIEDIRAGA